MTQTGKYTALIAKMRSLAADFDLLAGEEDTIPANVENFLMDMSQDLEWLAKDLEDWTKGKGDG